MCSRRSISTYLQTVKVLVNYLGQNRLTVKPYSSAVFISSSQRQSLDLEALKNKIARGKHVFLSKAEQFSSYTIGNELFSTGSTIFSLSSGHGKCGVAVVRISGPRASDTLKLIGQLKHTPASREAILRRLVDPETGIVIDKGIVILFQGPQSFTGEDCVEFQVHGGPAVVSALLTALHKVPGCRQAEPGEFTKRAFLNNKMDLTEVEGLGDLIHAETEVQRRQALRQMDGDLSRLYSKWRTMFIKCVADLEAFIDFSEDQNIEDNVILQVRHNINVLQKEIENHLNDNRQGERLREGVHVVIIGEPNVGKSSLLNAICQRPAAIVTDIAGTTRDVIESHVNIGGFPVLLSDTAGLRETKDIVEKEGVSRAMKRANEADVRVIVVDISSQDFRNIQNIDTFLSDHCNKLGLKGINFSDDHRVAKGELNCEDVESENEEDQFCKTIIVFNKVDLVPNSDLIKMVEVLSDVDVNIGRYNPVSIGRVKEKNNQIITKSDNISIGKAVDKKSDNILRKKKDGCDSTCCDVSVMVEDDCNLSREVTTFRNDSAENRSAQSVQDQEIIRWQGDGRKSSTDMCFISCVTGQGMDSFLDTLKDRVADLCGNPLSGHPSLTQARHRSHLIMCVSHLEQFDFMLEHDDIVLASEALRCTLREIGKITGKVSSEEILDVIFRDFCIGK